jgi:hypothetical protein
MCDTLEEARKIQCKCLEVTDTPQPAEPTQPTGEPVAQPVPVPA